jgi:hypothetical protein
MYLQLILFYLASLLTDVSIKTGLKIYRKALYLYQFSDSQSLR